MQTQLQVVVFVVLVAAAVGFLSKRVRVHYNVALVLVGALLGALRVGPALALEPRVVLEVFLPILLFEAAISTDLRRLRENLLPVVLLAGPGILVAVFAGGAIAHAGLGLAWPVALTLGAILATTDTIAVIAGFRRVRAPGRLTAIVENESLLNDGTALVAFTTLLAVVARGRFDPARGAVDLLWVTAVGLAVGVAVGYAGALVMRRTEDHLLEIMLTVAVTYGSAAVAEGLHASPILAVVAAGITVMMASWRSLTATSKVAIRAVWEASAFGVNSVVFLLIGMEMDVLRMARAAPAVAVGLLAVLVGRAASVYLTLAPLARGRSAVPAAWQHLLVWANLKGSLSMALVLSLPAAFPARELLATVVFGCALVTLTVQGLTLTRVARALGLGRAGEAERRFEGHQGRLLAARAGQTELDRLQHLGMLPLGVFQRLRAAYQSVIAGSERELRDLLALNTEEEARHLSRVRRHLLTVERAAVRDAVQSGILSEETARELAERIDAQLAELGKE